MYAALDFESQGFDEKTDAPTEIGVIVFDDNFKELGVFNFLIKSPLTRPQPQEIIDITGITDHMIEKDGVDEYTVVKTLYPIFFNAKALFAYNAPFDIRFLDAMIRRQPYNPLFLNDKVIVDVQRDVEYPARFTCKKLTHLAYDHKIFPEEGEAHRAIVDVRLMLKVLAKYDLQKVIKDASEPKVELRIKTPPPWEDKQGNEYAKANGYRFNPENKFWCKTIRESQVEETIKGSKYPVERI